MQVEDLDVLVAAVEHNSLNKASQVLNLSQPALSRRLSKLEEHLGVTLFERKGKRLELTAAGRMCYDHAIELRRLNHKFQRNLNDYRNGASLSLTIGASLTTLQSTLPDLVTMYTREFPHADIKALTGKTHEIVAMVRDKKVDLGLIASSLESPDLQCVPLFDDHLCLVLPAGHPLLASGPAPAPNIQWLDGLPMILFSRGAWYRVLVDELLERYGIAPDLRMEIDSFEATVRMAATCGLATLLPRSYMREVLLDYNGLEMLEVPELKLTTRTTSLIFLRNTSLAAETLEWIGRVQARFSSRLAP
ncbi:LysR family transcriptional regulator [Paenibacillus thermoaerophilus]|uniref:LysR family transcriptional regulator n=1 Tax=Paenibacillus thermoaerophilus TaxID=1215385 RepID=A0ABW2V646_9BACL|nr:LysR family transcriptional regulator [Paenibacillus thermoaerophilus]TMV05748.1 LysR family transcriptional regulator [Paenibacillus thermoaerophilus]TMV18367.1 LysR family transcriptional regulator [Paenibacillus thermoaerophilus]